ncbi:MAG TPA: molecular chaperone [Pseudomonas sp.]
MIFPLYRCMALLTAALLSMDSQAGIVLNTTRVIYPAADKEVSFGVHNTGSGEILLQSWLEPNADNLDSGSLPFVVTPALARLHGDGRQLLRIIYAGTDMPSDRESVLWLNVQEIPQAVPENSLQVAIRQRIKVFFRPEGLQGDAAQAPQMLRWRLGPSGLQVDNAGAYHVSMVKLALQQGSDMLMSKDSQMIAPGQSLQFPVEHRPKDTAVTLSFISINDFGGQESYRASLKAGQVAQAVKVEPR